MERLGSDLLEFLGFLFMVIFFIFRQKKKQRPQDEQEDENEQEEDQLAVLIEQEKPSLTPPPASDVKEMTFLPFVEEREVHSELENRSLCGLLTEGTEMGDVSSSRSLKRRIDGRHLLASYEILSLPIALREPKKPL